MWSSYKTHIFSYMPSILVSVYSIFIIRPRHKKQWRRHVGKKWFPIKSWKPCRAAAVAGKRAKSYIHKVNSERIGKKCMTAEKKVKCVERRLKQKKKYSTISAAMRHSHTHTHTSPAFATYHSPRKRANDSICSTPIRLKRRFRSQHNKFIRQCGSAYGQQFIDRNMNTHIQFDLYG